MTSKKISELTTSVILPDNGNIPIQVGTENYKISANSVLRPEKNLSEFDTEEKKNIARNNLGVSSTAQVGMQIASAVFTNVNVDNNANIETSKIKQTTITPATTTPASNDTQDILNNKFTGNINELKVRFDNLPIGASSGDTLFLTNTNSSITGYKELSKTPSTSPQVAITTTANNNEVLSASFVNPIQIGKTKLDAGIWQTNLFAYADHSTSCRITARFYKRNIVNAETLLFEVISPQIISVDPVNPDVLSLETPQQEFVVNTTDLVVVKFFVSTTRTSNTNITFYHSGSNFFSHIHTPLVPLHNDLKGLQGGTTGEYNHLTNSQVALVNDVPNKANTSSVGGIAIGAVGSALVDSNSIDFTSGATITADVKTANSSKVSLTTGATGIIADVVAGSLVNADINANANISTSKSQFTDALDPLATGNIAQNDLLSTVVKKVANLLPVNNTASGKYLSNNKTWSDLNQNAVGISSKIRKDGSDNIVLSSQATTDSGTQGNIDIRMGDTTTTATKGGNLVIKASNGTAGSGDIVFQTAMVSNINIEIGTNTTFSNANIQNATFSHTVPADKTNRLLLVSFVTSASSASSGVTYGGVAMTQISTGPVASTTANVQTYYLINPTSGTANVVITRANSGTIFAGAVNIANVDQTNPITGAIETFNNNQTTSASLTLNPTSVGQIAIGVIGTVSGTPGVPAGQTSIFIGSANGQEVILSTYRVVSGSTATMTHSFSNSSFAFHAFLLNQVSSSSLGQMQDVATINSQGIVSNNIQKTSFYSTPQTLTLLENSPTRLVFTNSSGSSNITMPNALRLSLGTSYEFVNYNGPTINIFFNTGTVLTTLSGANKKLILTLANNSTSSGSWLVNFDLTTGSNIAGNFSDRKKVYLSVNGNDGFNGFSQEGAVNTLSQALTLAGNSGNQVEVLPGTYAGNYSITQQNVSIIGSNSEGRGLCNFTGTLTSNNTGASSQLLQGLNIANVVNTSTGGLYINNSTINTSLSNSTSGYLEVEHCDLGTATISITGSGNKNFVSCNGGIYTINNAGAIVNIKDNLTVVSPTVTAGILSISNAIIYSVSNTPTVNAIDVASGAFLYLSNVNIIRPDGNPAIIRTQAGSFYSFSNVNFDRANSTLAGTNLSREFNFDNIRAGIVNGISNTVLQYISTLTSDAQAQINSKIATSLKGQPNGVAELGADGKVPTTQLPAFVDDVLEFDNLASFPATGEAGKIYVAKDTNLTYRWSGTQYVEISASLALGETSSTAYRGDRGKIAYDHSQIILGNPHNTTKADVGLGNADNTADVNKNVLSATKLTTARTINGVSFDGTANITVVDSTKEPAFTKNTAFNKNFGTTADTITEGNDARLGTKAVDETNIGNGRYQQYNATTNKLEYVLPTVTATDLSVANITTTTLDILSSTGNDATIPQATTTTAGLLNSTDKVKLNNTSGTNTGDQNLSGLMVKANNLTDVANRQTALNNLTSVSTGNAGDILTISGGNAVFTTPSGGGNVSSTGLTAVSGKLVRFTNATGTTIADITTASQRQIACKSGNIVASFTTTEINSLTWSANDIVYNTTDNIYLRRTVNNTWIEAGIRIGTYIDACFATEQYGWYLCNGQTKLISAFPDAYAILGNASLTDPTSFILPDLRGRVSGYVGTGTKKFSFNASAVNISTNAITAPNDFVFKRSAPVTITTTGTLPAPLVAGTIYYVSKITTTSFNLATTADSARDGGDINITTQGTGIHTLTLTYNERSLHEDYGTMNSMIASSELPPHQHQQNGYGGANIGSGAANATDVAVYNLDGVPSNLNNLPYTDFNVTSNLPFDIMPPTYYVGNKFIFLGA